ncbi:MAG: T9SS type A sorting domain-containing protein [Chitinivibrionia bacterium]|nr:T9SS type A sorting domain-containing protein [Chitinivibrionia bacterium]
MPQVVSDGAQGAIIAWGDDRGGEFYADLYAQRVEKYGLWGWPSARIASIVDVPGDQGGYVTLSFEASRLDRTSPPTVVTMYSVYRRNGASWELTALVDAEHMSSYSCVVPTVADWTVPAPYFQNFRILAEECYECPNGSWYSPIDSGLSIDNIAPAAPAGVTALQSITPPGLQLTWTPNGESDFLHYLVYRGVGELFIPDGTNLIAMPDDPEWFDAEWRWYSGYYYKLAAYDIHYNRSLFTLVSPGDVTGAETPPTPLVTCLRQNFPNPFNPATRISYDLAAGAHVSLCVYDVNGSLVRTLVDQSKEPGTFAATWDGENENGEIVASGVYFYRLKAGDFIETKRMILCK